jgi:hypothetical protein
VRINEIGVGRNGQDKLEDIEMEGTGMALLKDKEGSFYAVGSLAPSTSSIHTA